LLFGLPFLLIFNGLFVILFTIRVVVLLDRNGFVKREELAEKVYRVWAKNMRKPAEEVD
jgi:hypothetical protein